MSFRRQKNISSGGASWGWGMKNNGIRSALHKLPGINFNFYATQKLQKQPEFPTRVGAIQNQK